MVESGLKVPERLVAAALDLFSERGFAETTAVQIAERAGVSRATLFRYVPDKREVLFLQQERLRDLLTDGAKNAPDDATPMQAVAAALQEIATAFPESDRVFAPVRRAVIAAAPELQERTALKREGLARALEAELLRRGAASAEAGLAAGSGLIAFRHAHERWADLAEPRSFSILVRDSLVEIEAAMATFTAPALVPPPTGSPALHLLE